MSVKLYSDTNVTKHFSKKELTVSSTADRMGIKNTPTDAEWENILYLATQLEKIREYLGAPIRITSAFRSEKVNKLVGGSSTSAHRYGLAADMSVAGMSSRSFANKIIAMRDKGLIKFDQLILEFPERGTRSWVHIGFKKNGVAMRNQLLTASAVNGKTKYTAGITK